MKRNHAIKNHARSFVAFALAFAMLLSNLIIVPVYAADTPKEVTVSVNLNEYVVFDLEKESVIIGDTKYKGTRYVKNADTNQWELQSAGKDGVTRDTKKIYVFQSSTKKTEVKIEGDILYLTSVDIDNNISINNDIDYVRDEWDKAAKDHRTQTNNYIAIETSSKDCDITIDDLWTMNQNNGTGFTNNHGGLNINVGSQDGMLVTLRLRGDNRMGNVTYSCKKDTNDKASGLIVCDDETDGAENIGCLTVIGDPGAKGTNGSANYKTEDGKSVMGYNNWNSVFGGLDSDTDQFAYNMYFESGVVYAGANYNENCTAIGAGGNGVGEVFISGTAVVTAITHSTGTAIGGGIAHIGTGGEGWVDISGGTVYAYNYGLHAYDLVRNNAYGTTDSEIIAASKHVPGTAIGGAGSIKIAGSTGKVNISGGTVYAESLGGAAIGGGNTIGLSEGKHNGGAAVINILGGNITAKSTSETITFKDGTTFDVPSGTAIGGGSTVGGKGGEATVNISGGIIDATGIGGGKSTQGNGGGAKVTMSGGTVVSTGIGGGFSETYGYTQGEVTVTGGSLNSAMAAIPKNDNDEVLSLTRISFFEGANTLVNEKLDEDAGLRFGDAGTSYKYIDTYTDELGMIYVWLPEDVRVVSGKLEGQPDDTNFTPNDEADRDIDTGDIGSLIYDSNVPRYIVTVAGSPKYNTYLDKEKKDALYGSAIVEQGTFNYYLEVEEGYTVKAYGGMETDGVKTIVLLPNAMELIGDNFYKVSEYVQRDTAVWHSVVKDGRETFSIDLSVGDVIITETEDGIVIEQNGYKFSSASIDIYLTTAGYPTSNTVTVTSELDKEKQKPINITADEINIIASESAITVEKGILDLSVGQSDNMIHSIEGSPIQIGEYGSLNLSMGEKDSLKLSSSNPDASRIIGAGSLNIADNKSFLTIDEPKNGASQIAVGAYSFEGDNNQFTADIYKGKYERYTVIGFVQGDQLYSLEVNPEDGKKFAARGIYEIYNGVKSSWEVLSDGSFELTLSTTTGTTMGLHKITDEEGNVYDISPVLSGDGKTVTYTFPKNAFVDKNYIINAAAKGKIPYNVVANDVKYDGGAHGIEVIVDETLFEVYYSESEINDSTGSTTMITYVDVYDYETYFYICAREGVGEYDPVISYASFSILVGQNEWLPNGSLSCSDIICGQKPSATAAAKWGEVVYKYYYEDTDAEIDVKDFENITKDTNFYVVASVAEGLGAKGQTNYEELVSDRIYFTAIVLSAYAKRGRQLDRITDATTDTLELNNTGAFSVYFKSNSVGEASNINFTTELNEGTKITFVDLNDDTARYYYHFVTAEDVEGGETNIELTKFISMGTQGATEGEKFSPTSGESIEYQFCIEYENMSDPEIFNITLNNQSGASTTAVFKFAWIEQFDSVDNADDSEDKISVEAGDKEIRVTVKPDLNGAGNKFLAFKISGKDPNGNDFSLVNMETALSVKSVNSSSESSAPIIESTNDYVLFKLGAAEYAINDEYTLIISNVDPGTYTLNVTADVRMFEEDKTDGYVLEKETAENHVELDKTITVSDQHFMYVELAANDRIVTSSERELVFNIETKGTFSTEELYVTLFKKQDGKYVELATESVEFNTGTDNITVQNNYFVNQTEDKMTYRLYFQYEGATYYYNLIVVK